MTTQIINPEDIGIYLKDTRKKYKMSQKELAKWIWISQYSIIRYEKNNYLQASSQIVFSILAYFIQEHVKGTITLSIMPKHENQ